MKAFLICIFSLTTLANLANGQGTDVTVRIIDAETKKPIRNANVVIAGTTKGAVTNALGFCKLNHLPDERQLVISHVSYQSGSANILANIASFAVALKKAVVKLPDIDLAQYPNHSKGNNFAALPRKFRNLKDSVQVVESYADFPYEGGIEIAFKTLFGNAFHFPEKALTANQSGTIPFEFTIDESGNYTSSKCLTDSTSETCAELKKILTVLPHWRPATQYGEAVKQTFMMNVHYAPNKYWKREIRATHR